MGCQQQQRQQQMLQQEQHWYSRQQQRLLLQRQHLQAVRQTQEELQELRLTLLALLLQQRLQWQPQFFGRLILEQLSL
jgi:restriction endonuclease Mrr